MHVMPVRAPLTAPQVLITAAARVPDSVRFLDPRRAVTFEFDHMSLVRPAPALAQHRSPRQIASDPQPIATHAETEALRFVPRSRLEYSRRTGTD